MKYRPYIIEQWFWEAVAVVVGVGILVVIIVVVPIEAVNLVLLEAGEGVWAGWAVVGVVAVAVHLVLGEGVEAGQLEDQWSQRQPGARLHHEEEDETQHPHS